MKQLFFALALGVFSSQAAASDWGGPTGTIDKIWYYGDKIIVEQDVPAYAGEAGCKNNNRWGFYLSDLADESKIQRIFSILIATKAAGARIKPLYDSTQCGPEGHKKFVGNLVIL